MSQKMLKPLLMALSVVMLVSLACVVPGGLVAGPTETPVILIVTATPPPPEPTPLTPTDTAVVEPTVKPTEPPENRFSYEGVSFVPDTAIATGNIGSIIPANPPSADGPWWDSNPEYINISFDGYVLGEKFHDPRLMVYSVEEYSSMDENAKKIIDELKSMLATKPDDAENMPLLALWNAAQVFHSNVKYVDFENGSGVRYLSEYAQYTAPINNTDMFYTYQGITSDGRYYVSIILPASHPSLPIDSSQIPGGDWQAFSDNYPKYLTDTIGVLNSQPDANFAPALDRIDALIQSLKIEK